MTKASLDRSIADSMDGIDTALIPFLPYILQDFWTIGSDPEVITGLIRKHKPNHRCRVLDLGCGKGAVSTVLAKEHGCQCLGIDALAAFIDEAQQRAVQAGVDSLCRFEVGDVRTRVKELRGFDIVVLGAIGTVFGNYEETLASVSPCLAPHGIVIIDDGYSMEPDS